MLKKKKRHKNPQPSPTVGVSSAIPAILDVRKIKQDAMNEALQLLGPNLKLVEEERARIRQEAYNEALDDAMRYLVVCGSKALNNKYHFGYIRLERYIDETMRLAKEGNVKELTAWLEKVGFKITFIKEQKE